MTNIQISTFSALTADARTQFRAFVEAAGEVNLYTLPDLMVTAVALISLTDDHGNLIGTAAIKRPNENYRRSIFKKAGVGEQADCYAIELGWIHVHPDYRGQGHPKRLMGAAIEVVNSNNVYATTKAAKMHTILPRFGFSPLGSTYVSLEEPDEQLTLYIRRA